MHTIISQRLVPNKDGTRTPCLEILKKDAGVQDAIASNDLLLLSGIIEASNSLGMHSFDQYLAELLATNVISLETAFKFATNRHKFEMRLQGFVQDSSILKPDAYR
jgi:twitching motility protein PilU